MRLDDLGTQPTYLDPLPPVDPGSYAPWNAWEVAQRYAQAFLSLNGLRPVVEFHSTPRREGLKSFDPRNFGEADIISRHVFVNVPRCARPTRGKPVMAWSFTGYKADRTVYGVTMHEVGHHVHVDKMLEFHRNGWDDIDWQLFQIKRDEAAVSSYEPNSSEVFTEAFRLFTLNPNLLRLGRPRRWQFLTEVCRLVPPHDSPWEEVLKHAHEAYFSAARNWIAMGHKKRRA